MSASPYTPAQNVARYGTGCLDAIGEYSSVYQDERITAGALTLGAFIDALGHYNPALMVRTDTGKTLTTPHAYRGYYVDLSFEPSSAQQTVGDLRALAVSAVGQVFPGWKAGTFRMNTDTPVWVAHRGDTGRYLTGLTSNPGGLVVTTAAEYHD